MKRLFDLPRNWLVLPGSFAIVVIALVMSYSAKALTIDGTAADKNNFRLYLVNQGASGNANSFTFLNNGNMAGPSVLAANPNLTTNHFGARMAGAAMLDMNDNPVFPLTVNVGRDIPRVFFGAFRWDPVNGDTDGEQTIDLNDILNIPIRSNNDLIGGTDIILHEVFEGISGLGMGATFEPAHFGSGYQEENSNRTADNNRGTRVVDPTRPDEFKKVAPGRVRFKTAWDVIAGGNVLRSGYFVINGRVVGANNFTVTDVQPGYSGVGGDSDNLYNFRVNSAQFVPEPATALLLFLGAFGAIPLVWRRRR